MSFEALAIFQQATEVTRSAGNWWKSIRNRGRRKAAKEELAALRARRREGSETIYLVADESEPRFELFEWMADEGMLRRTSRADLYLLPEDHPNPYL
jgi:hypothetical protein